MRLSTVYLCFTSSHFCTVCEFGMKARGYAYVFPRKRQQLVLIFSAKGGKIPFKKHQILMSAVTFSANGPWKQFLTKWKVLAVNNMKTGPAILSWKILYHQRWRTNVPFHSIQKLCFILCYSESFKWMRSNQNTGKN